MSPLPVMVAAIVVGVCYAPGLHNEFFRDTWRYTLVNLSITVLLATVIFSGGLPVVNRFLNWNPMQKLGVWSYSIYIWHQVVGDLLGGLALPFAAIVALKFATVIVVSGLSYTFIEKPAKRLREQFKRFVTARGPSRQVL
jgi:peptidoglycan/LPS O-acetylase OafA/YrhL